MGKYLELTGSDFEATLSEGVSLVDFWAPWCGPCRMIASTIEELAETEQVVKVNTDECNMLAQKLGIRSIPTILVYKDGVEVEREMGAKSKQQFQDLIDKHK